MLLATDLPTFGSLARLENACGCPVLTSDQAILWASLRSAGVKDRISNLGKLMER